MWPRPPVVMGRGPAPHDPGTQFLSLAWVDPWPGVGCSDEPGGLPGVSVGSGDELVGVSVGSGDEVVGDCVAVDLVGDSVEDCVAVDVVPARVGDPAGVRADEPASCVSGVRPRTADGVNSVEEPPDAGDLAALLPADAADPVTEDPDLDALRPTGLRRSGLRPASDEAPAAPVDPPSACVEAVSCSGVPTVATATTTPARARAPETARTAARRAGAASHCQGDGRARRWLRTASDGLLRRNIPSTLIGALAGGPSACGWSLVSGVVDCTTGSPFGGSGARQVRPWVKEHLHSGSIRHAGQRGHRAGTVGASE